MEELKFGDENGNDDSIEFSAYRNQISICIDEPWAGCTETGFGQKNHFDLNLEQTAKLRDFLNRVLSTPTNTDGE